MGKGKTYQDTQFRYIDSHSKREVVRLTDYRGHSHHMYFTDPCWFNEGRSFVFASDRENQGNLFRYDLDMGLITQLTGQIEATPARPQPASSQRTPLSGG